MAYEFSRGKTLKDVSHFRPDRRLSQARDLVRELVVRDIKLRYKRSVLGIAWSFFNPLAQLLVFTFIFRRVLKLEVPHYSSFVFCGLLPWNWFQSSLYLSAVSVTENRELVKRPGLPPAVLPAVRVLSDLIHFLCALPVLMSFLLLDGIPLTPAVLLLPLVVALQCLLTIGLAYLVALPQVTFRDTQYLLGLLLLLMFYLSPVFYDASAVPDRYRPFYRLNPMVHLIDGYRAVLIDGRQPDYRPLIILALLSGGLLLFSFAVFRRASHRFAEEL